MSRFAVLPPAFGLFLTLTACASGPDLLSTDGWFNKPLDVSSGVSWGSTARHQISKGGPVPPEDFVDGQGNCAPSAADSEAMAAAAAAAPAAAAPAGAGAAPGTPATPGAGAPAPLPGGGVALEMTECQVVRRTGAPDRVEIGSNERGERSVTVTYLRGPRPGIYKFTGGRLTVVEKAPEVAPQRPTRQARPPKRA